MSETKIIAEQRELIDAYERLDLTTKQLLQIAAVADSQSRTRLSEMAKKLKIKNGEDKTLDTRENRNLIDGAIQAGLFNYVANSNVGPIEVSYLLNDYVFRQAYASGMAQKVVDLVDPPTTDDNFGYHYHWSSGGSNDKMARQLRMAFYSANWDQWHKLKERSKNEPYLLDPFDLEWFNRLPSQFRSDFLKRTARQLTVFGESRRGEIARLAMELFDGLGDLSDEDIVAATDLFAAQGNISALESLAGRCGTYQSQIQGCAEFLKGNFDYSRQCLEAAIKQQRTRSKKRRIDLPHMPQIFLCLLLLRENSAEAQNQLKLVFVGIEEWTDDWKSILDPLIHAYQIQSNLLNKPRGNLGQIDFESKLAILFAGLNWSWFHSDQEPPSILNWLIAAQESYADCNLDWFAAQLSSILAKIEKDTAKAKMHTTNANQILQLQGSVSLVDFMQPLPAWQAGLIALENLGASTVSVTTNSSDKLNDERMIWELQCVSGGSQLHLTPFAQKRGSQSWTKGRKIALERLYEQWQTPLFNFLTEQDRAICRCLGQKTVQNYYGYRETVYSWDNIKLASALVGHPHIYWGDQRDQSIQIAFIRPHLSIQKKEEQYKLEVHPKCKEGQSLCVSIDGTHRVSLVSYSDLQRQVSQLVACLPLIPAAEQPRLFKIAESLSPVIDIQSDMESGQSLGESVTASARIVIQLTPFQQGLRAELFVQPIGANGPFCRPGVGATSVMANVNGKFLNTTRDLKAELENVQKVLTHCHCLNVRTLDDKQTEWLIGESDDALELVEQLQSLSEQEMITVLWPQGKSFEVASIPSLNSFHISIKRDHDWFAASGDLKVDDRQTLDLMKLLELASVSPSRFVRMDDGRFLALSKELRQRIADITAFSTVTKGALRFAPVRALIVDELLGDTCLKTDKNWKSLLKQIHDSASVPVVAPSTLQAELRDYQKVGFAWLKRLAHWNSGACLADDMGLGKTIQALGFLVDRAFDGPSLVVAPASVGFNWENETRRFAPTLTPKLFRDSDRDQFFDNIHPGDLVIVSYGLLQSEIERFEKVNWNVVLLDEAQAIKNMATKRSQAVMQLQAAFKLILTGTPIENHLGELWNLFRFIVPGLLGSQEQFRERFAIPIERDNCRATRNRLKKLIQPFILRRTKSEVLAELPARSETLLEIELSTSEVALYEALRLKALELIEQASSAGLSPGERHLRVLAELTRLRLACCHPSLVGGHDIESTKLSLFREKVREIIEGKHKVLVFSQFVKHLAILRNELELMGVSYQYLDGSTPIPNRKLAVEAFQAGTGDVFLISLKAGGTGLNLTAADYVIHMDPWWNPAVEDQATDRAHRIGQQRPVNVYRFICKGTIEEKMVNLHNTKRDLADSLLDGTDTAAKLTTDELIGLLRENRLVEA